MLLGGALCFGISRAFGRRLVAHSDRVKELDRGLYAALGALAVLAVAAYAYYRRLQ